MKKMFLGLTLIVLTGLNLFYAAPWKVSACNCYANGHFVCSGQCCDGDGTWCTCWDKGRSGLC